MLNLKLSVIVLTTVNSVVQSGGLNIDNINDTKCDISKSSNVWNYVSLCVGKAGIQLKCI